MRIYINLFFFGALFLTACKSNSVPDGIIPEKKMTGLLTEVHITDGSLYTVSQMPDSLYKYGMDRYLNLFKRYGTDTAQFKKSMQYYTSHPEILEVMYTDISQNMTAKTDSINKVRTKAEATKADSVNKANKKREAARIDSLKKIKKNIKK